MTKVGIVGAGQLGLMLGQAGRALNLEFLYLDPAADPPAAMTGTVLQHDFDNSAALARLAEETDIVTYEFENVPVKSIEILSRTTAVFPPADALRQAQDRLLEKQLFQRLDIPLPAFRTVDTPQDLHDAVSTLGLPLVLKTRRFGYDGKGQLLIRKPEEQAAAWKLLGKSALIAEQFIEFDREVSIIGARRCNGDTAIYPLTENSHEGGILKLSKAPATGDRIADMATTYLADMLDDLDYVGVLALELFVRGNDLLANEFAPRVHNSGHWTIEGAVTSQFENHLRAILDLPLGDTAMKGHAAMVNLVGTMPAQREQLVHAGFQLHDYGKSPRPGRKLGHATTVADTAQNRDERLEKALKLLAN